MENIGQDSFMSSPRPYITSTLGPRTSRKFDLTFPYLTLPYFTLPYT